MNYLILTAGVIAALATIGHTTMGSKKFLRPVMKSDLDLTVKKVMQSLFHYMSVFMVLTTFFLIAISTGGCQQFENTPDVVKLIGFIYAGFAIVQFIIAATSKIKMGIFKLFQWIFWALIAFFTLFSVYG
ncbi:MAG TPA: hypothetical protein QF480_06290 [Bacteroidales bacterium]|jgi:hypothetical protein|nr:hypothetical protein [Bacteroidales bacterium]|tara:strand:- start:48 stop:437 length:390 start_codon:yes stop_codon:yes gene_type:complete